ncbi:MAG TPA: spore germination protein GerW family protein [Solirubrobacterales bacterium]
MAGLDDVRAEIEASAGAGDFVERLAQRMSGAARAEAVFGDVVERGGVSVIPVARAMWGFGGGGGVGDGEEGSGGGGGGLVRPIGFIEIRGGEASFRRIRDPRPPLIAAAAVLLAAVAARLAARR